MSFHGLANTQYFKEAALDFKKNNGFYTRAPIGSREWTEYWEMHEKRCLEGYQVGDTYITGRHYFYLNFTPIMRVTDSLGATKKAGNQIMDKEIDFADFYEIGYEWYRFKQIAWFGGTFMGITSPGAKHLVAAKTRGAGWSFQEASDGAYNYTFFAGSKSYYFAGLEDYLIKDGILSKVQPMLDWINEHCPYWSQNRQKKNSLMYMRASYLDEFGTERGSFSEIMGVIVDDPNKTRGKRGKKIVFEEAGSFKNLKKSLIVSMGSIKDGSYYVGQISVFGTGGETGPSIEGLEEIFYEPDAYDMLAFPNIYEEGMESTKCGYFVPVFRSNRAFMDEDGNVDIQGSIDHELKQREVKGKARDKKTLDDYVAEYPFYPGEAFKRMGKNPFWVDRIDRQMKRIERDTAIKALIRHGYMKAGEKGGEFVHSDSVTPILQYPHKDSDDLTGCCTMYEAPYYDHTGQVPDDMYELVFDPFYNDEAEDQTSLFHFWVWKKPNPHTGSFVDLPVFEYAARPEDLNDCYEQLFLACDLYNCKAQGEIAGGGKGVIDYAKTKHLMHKIHFEPETMAKDKEIGSTGRNRSYLMNMSTEAKKLGLTYLVQWHKEVRGVNEQGENIYNIDCVYSLGFLRELRKFDGKKNADRISSAIVGRFQIKSIVVEMTNREERKAMDDFYERQFVNKEYYSESNNKLTSSYGD